MSLRTLGTVCLALLLSGVTGCGAPRRSFRGSAGGVEGEGEGPPGEGEGEDPGEGEGEGPHPGEGEGEGPDPGEGEGEGGGGGDVAPGGACECDSDCSTPEPGFEPICVYGVCMIRASGECASGGSRSECPDGLRCWSIQGVPGTICWPDCETFECAGDCDGDGSCVMTADSDCDPDCGSYCSGGGGDPGGGGDLSCSQVYDCMVDCGSDQQCQQGCKDRGSDTAQRRMDAMLGCFRQECGDVEGDAWQECVQARCGAEIETCFSGGCESDDDCDEGWFCDPETHACACGSDDVCPEGQVCDPRTHECREPPCEGDADCPGDRVCRGGRCVTDFGPGPEGPPPECDDLPEIECDGTSRHCSELIQFDPTEGRGYVDYPENGETWNDQYRSWLRRDFVLLVQYAAAYVDCKLGDWDWGNGGPIGLIDMSEENGDIPGTRDGQPGHPQNTHEDGRDIDIAYFQVDTEDNAARPVCDHYEPTRNGAARCNSHNECPAGYCAMGRCEAYHCTAPPHLLDPWRTALLIGALHEGGTIRVLGVDGQVGPIVAEHIQLLCDDGWLSRQTCRGINMAYEEEDQGHGWFRFHHHHMHISFSPPRYGKRRTAAMPPDRCLVPGCDAASLDAWLAERGVRARPERLPARPAKAR